MSKYILEQIKIEGVLRDIIAVSTGDNVKVTIDGKTTTLTEALASIITGAAALPTTENVSSAISAAIDELIGGAPSTYDTLKEIADYISEHEDVVTALNAAIGNKVEKVEGKGLSANDFTDAFKAKLEGLKPVEASGTNGNILVDGNEVRVYTHPSGEGNAHIPAGGVEGQILTRTASGYAFADAPSGVRYGEAAPEDMKNGELFIRVVSE